MKKLAEMAYRQFPKDAKTILAAADRVCENRYIFTDKWDLEQEPFEIRFETEIDWEIDANGDPEYIWQFNRHRYFICLGQAYLMTGEEVYAKKMAELLADWIRRIPLTPEHEMKAWRSLEAGFRGEYWTKAVSYIQDSPAWTQELQDLYMASLYQHAEYIEKKHSDYKYISNWGVIENHGLFEIALALLDSEKKEHYIHTAFSVLSQAARIQFMEDGVHWEQSPTYHCEVVRCYLDVLLLAKKHGITVPDEIKRTVRKALDVMLAWKKPDGAMFMNGDSDDIDMAECFILGAYYFGDGRYKYAAEGNMDFEAVWNLGWEGMQAYEALPMEEPEGLSAAFCDSGHFYFRSGWGRDANLLHFTCGTLGAGHGHSDKLHVDLVMCGRDILVDSGRYTYAWANGRERYKNPQAHNTTIADGKLFTVCKDSWECSKLCQPANTAYKFTEDYEYAQGGHLGYIEDGIFVNRRVIHIKPDIYVIADEMYTGGTHTYETFFHFNEAGKTEVTKYDEAVYQDAVGKVQIFFRSETLEQGNAKVERQKSNIARHYNSEEENDCLVVTQQQEGFTSLYTVLAGGSVRECRRLPVESVLKHKVYESKLAEALSIVTEETEYIVIICHQEVNSPTDLAGVKDCKGFGNVIIFDRRTGCFGGTALHW